MVHSQPSSRSRAGATLLELILVVAILAVLVGLLLPAIQKVRSQAVRLKTQNNLRQISLATHEYAVSNGEFLPYFAYRNEVVESCPLVFALLHIGQYQGYGGSPEQWWRYVGALFQSPTDPSFAENPNARGDSSYVASALVFRKGRSISNCAPDGLSNTLAWTEQYANCGTSGFRADVSQACEPDMIGGKPFYIGGRRHSFADRECGDVYPRIVNGVAVPVRDGWPVPTQTFAVLPRAADCKYSTPTASHPAGLCVALLDGSIRTISPSVSSEVFWGLVTPDGGEVVTAW